RILTIVFVKISAVFIYITLPVIAFGIPIAAKRSLKSHNIQLLMSQHRWQKPHRAIIAMLKITMLKVTIAKIMNPRFIQAIAIAITIQPKALSKKYGS